MYRPAYKPWVSYRYYTTQHIVTHGNDEIRSRGGQHQGIGHGQLMRMPDVNILVYAHRRDEANHTPYAPWLKSTVEEPQPFALSVLISVGFVRMVTNPWQHLVLDT